METEIRQLQFQKLSTLGNDLSYNQYKHIWKAFFILINIFNFMLGIVSIWLGFKNWDNHFWMSNSQPTLDNIGVDIGNSLPFIMWGTGLSTIFLAVVGFLFLRNPSNKMWRAAGQSLSLFWAIVFLYLGNMAYSASSSVEKDIDKLCDGGFPHFAVFSRELIKDLSDA